MILISIYFKIKMVPISKIIANLIFVNFQCKQQLNADGYGSHTSPTHHTVRTPLVPRDLGEDFSLDFDDDPPLDPRKPKNAKYVETISNFDQINFFNSIFILRF